MAVKRLATVCPMALIYLCYILALSFSYAVLASSGLHTIYAVLNRNVKMSTSKNLFFLLSLSTFFPQFLLHFWCTTIFWDTGDPEPWSPDLPDPSSCPTRLVKVLSTFVELQAYNCHDNFRTSIAMNSLSLKSPSVNNFKCSLIVSSLSITVIYVNRGHLWAYGYGGGLVGGCHVTWKSLHMDCMPPYLHAFTVLPTYFYWISPNLLDQGFVMASLIPWLGFL